MRFIKNEYETNLNGTKSSYTTVEHLGVAFLGEATTAPNEPYPSELFGGRLSESRAILHALQYEKDALQDQYTTISNFIKSCVCTKQFDNESPSAKVMYHQLNIAKKKLDRIKKEIEYVKFSIKNMMDSRDKYFEKRAKGDNK